ncbi:MAG: hypothetical protein V2I37_09235 [Marinilabiliaceae bacterium]|jgi:hypothetical protein|nr:hypothetical protein [Marinilabiliaceae bacterium]
MVKNIFLILLLFVSFTAGSYAQKLITAESIVQGSETNSDGRVSIKQDPAIDSLLTRHIVANRKYGGFDGFRIQIYSGSKRTAREESNDVISEFISEFPEIKYNRIFDLPNFFKVRVGNYRTKRDALEDFLLIKKKFPNAYIVPDKIEFPDLEK